MNDPATRSAAERDYERQLREMNETLLVSSVRQHELTEQAQKAEAALRESEHRYRTIVDQVKDYAIFSVDPQGRPTTWNQGVKQVLGFEEAEFVGKDITKIIVTPEDIQDRVPEKELEQAAREGSASNDRWMRRKGGSRFFANGVTTAQRDEAGQLLGFTKVMRDQTERKQAEALLQSQKEALEMVARQEPLIDVLDFLARAVESQSSEGLLAAIHLLNPAGTHFASAAAPSLPPAYLQASEGLAIASRSDPCCDAVLSGEPVSVPDVAHDPRFAEFALSCGIRAGWSTPIFSSGGTVVGTFANYYREPRQPSPRDQQMMGIVTRTVTLAIEHKQAEQQTREQAAALSDLHRRKDEFLAMLSHELRNPLAPIANAVQVLRLQRGSENPIEQQARTIIERQVGQLKHLVDDLLEVSRITTGRVQLRQERVAVSGIVERAVETARPLIVQRLTVSLPPQPIWLHADAARLEQVVVNLLTNAAKYTDEGGHIWLTVEVRGQESGVRSQQDQAPHDSSSLTPDSCLLTPEAVLRVRDTGVGIAPELLPRIFDLFTQSERSLDRSQGGLGIGLSLVQRLVELHGGTVEAYSVLGQGSEFVVRLPVMRTSVPPSPSTETAPPTGKCFRVLVVDDNVDSAESLAMLLRASRHEVRTAHDGPTALQAALNYRPDVVLLDIGLPGLNGYEVAKRLRQQSVLQNVVLVAMTGYGQETDRQRSQEAGFDHHLVKPADYKNVQTILTSVSEKAK